MALTPKARQALKAKAHQLKPIVMIGNKGLTDAVKKEIDIGLYDHELIKIRLSTNDREEKQAMITELCNAAGAELVQLIGKICVVYRRSDKA